MLRPSKASTFLILLSLIACDKNHRIQDSYRALERDQLPPEHTQRITKDYQPQAETLLSLQKGQKLYVSNCVACHGYSGQGDGIVTKKGLTPPRPFNSNRAHVVEVLTDGYGRMPSFQRRLDVSERWMVASYVMALQLSRRFPAKNLDKSDREQLP